MPTEIHQQVQDAYTRLVQDDADDCCKTSCCSGAQQPAPIGDLGVSCGDPVVFCQLKPGQTVLDLGSGAGRDVFQATEAVGPTGHVIGVDMTEAMLVKASANAATLGVNNVTFKKGLIEALPIEADSIDTVISNCVINLSTDKPAVFNEVFRVLKPGGQMVISDVVLARPLPQKVKDNPDLYCSCVGGALLRQEYLDIISNAGFTEMTILSEKPYLNLTVAEASECCAAGTIEPGMTFSITVSARKPAG
jgi:SAM-dependent methyltransferase